MKTLELRCIYAQKGEIKEDYNWTGTIIAEESAYREGTYNFEGASIDSIDNSKRYICSYNGLAPETGTLEFSVFTAEYETIDYLLQKLEGTKSRYIGAYYWINRRGESTFGGYTLLEAKEKELSEQEFKYLGENTVEGRLVFGNLYPTGAQLEQMQILGTNPSTLTGSHVGLFAFLSDADVEKAKEFFKNLGYDIYAEEKDIGSR